MLETMIGDEARSSSRLRALVPARLRRMVRAKSWWLVVAAFALLTLLITIFNIYMMRAASERREAERWHTHTLEILQTGADFRTSTFDILRGERGYLLTGNESFLEPYIHGRRAAAPHLERLEQLVQDNPVQSAQLARVRSRLESFAGIVDRTVELERTGAHEQALATVRSGIGRQEFLRLQASIEAVEAEERRLLIARREALSATTSWNERMGYAAAGIIIILLGIAALGAVGGLRAQRRASAAAEELRRLATVDELTGLPNRRHFVRRLEEETARARRNGSPLCLATLDLDHFKRINDLHGHPAGDAVLRQLAIIIRQKIRLEDSAARLGGEEFALLLPNSNAFQAQLVCDRLRSAVASRLFELPGSGTVRVTLSTGVAALNGADDCETLMSRSDQALYEAKACGRNQVRLAA
jgi:diguanylate cyclase (GGDEF)-like protein